MLVKVRFNTKKIWEEGCPFKCGKTLRQFLKIWTQNNFQDSAWYIEKRIFRWGPLEDSYRVLGILTIYLN
jgi:hypothetical protein